MERVLTSKGDENTKESIITSRTRKGKDFVLWENIAVTFRHAEK